MLERVVGRVEQFRPLSRNSIQLHIAGFLSVVELTISEAWVVRKGDTLVVVGELSPDTGKFIGIAYKNVTCGVCGCYSFADYSSTVETITMLLFIWAVIPFIILVRNNVAVHKHNKRISEAIMLLEQD